MASTARNPFITPPTQPSEQKPGQLSCEQLEHFFTKGWLIVTDFIDKQLLERVKHGIMKQVDDIIERLHKAGKITDKHQDKDLFTRMTYIEKQFPDAAVLLHTTGILPDGVKELWSYEKLLNVGEQIIGPDIAGHPVWNLRVKLPSNEASVVPWHQDTAYLSNTRLDTMQLTAWIPLLDTNEFNGGMEVIGNTHHGELAPHYGCPGNTWYLAIEDDNIEKTFGCKVESKTSCIVPYGGVLLFGNTIVHRSTNNSTNNIRWSMDLRWQDPQLPNGRDNLNEGMPLMKKSGEIIQNIDWSVMSNRQQLDRSAKDNETEDKLETRIGGPWMKHWPIKHKNAHTEFYLGKSQG